MTWLFYAESRPQCWWPGEGGMHWGCGGDIKLVASHDSGTIWSHPRVTPPPTPAHPTPPPSLLVVHAMLCFWTALRWRS